MRVEFATIVVLDRKYEVNPHTLSILSSLGDQCLVFSLKTEIGHILA